MADNRISSSTNTSFDPTIAEGRGPSVMPKPGPTSNAERHRVEAAERAYATAHLSPMEAQIAERASHLGPHQSIELTCKGLLSAELASKVEGKISIERRDDGAFEVTTFGAAAMGIGNEHFKAMPGIAAGTKFVVQTPEAAADLAQAIATSGGVATAKAMPGFPWAHVVDRATGASAHAAERLDHYRANVTEMQGEARAILSAHFELHAGSGLHAHAGAEGMATGGVKVDFEKGELTASARLDVSAEARAYLNLGHGTVAKSLGQMTFDVEVEGKDSWRLEARKQLPPKLAEKLKRGELSAEDAAKALSNAKTEWVVVAEIEVEKSITGMMNGVGKAKLTTEIPLEGEAIAKQLAAGDLTAIAKPLIDAEWEVEGELGVGDRLSVQAQIVAGEMSAMTWVKAKSAKGSLAHCLEHADHELNDQVAMQKQLDRARH
ncbi:MAG: hypothetical protein GQE15_35300 [Archangiaceae bacterium]|nr:hypothetical protein [Archangiaceae bacterium]